TEATITSPDELSARLRRIRADGHVVADGLIHPDARGIAVPVRRAGDEVVAAISVVVADDTAPVAPHIAVLHAASARITADLRAAYGRGGAPAGTPSSRYRRLVARAR